MKQYASVRKWFCNPLIFHNSLLAYKVRECTQVILEVIENKGKLLAYKVRGCVPPYPPKRAHTRARARGARVHALSSETGLPVTERNSR